MRYRIHISLGERVQTFSTSEYQRENGRITFTDKFGQKKDFADTPKVIVGIEDMWGNSDEEGSGKP
jgi:hypothetical protein